MLSRRLLLSIHDVTPATVPQVERLHKHLCDHGTARALAMLVVPDHWNSTAVASDSSFKSWLRARHGAGDEIILHGWSHRDESRADSAFSRFKGRWMTAGEGEFLSLLRDEALRRLRDGRALLEDIIGAPVPGFVAPAWLYGPGARAALAEAGFAFAEDHFRVWAPQSGAILARGPVITWATRSVPRAASSLAFAAVARATLNAFPTVRIGVHPGDAGAPHIMSSIAATVRRFRRSHALGRYVELTIGSAPRDAAKPDFNDV